MSSPPQPAKLRGLEGALAVIASKLGVTQQVEACLTGVDLGESSDDEADAFGANTYAEGNCYSYPPPESSWLDPEPPKPKKYPKFSNLNIGVPPGQACGCPSWLPEGKYRNCLTNGGLYPIEASCGPDSVGGRGV